MRLTREQQKDRAGHLRFRAGHGHRRQRPLQVLQAQEEPGQPQGTSGTAEAKKVGRAQLHSVSFIYGNNMETLNFEVQGGAGGLIHGWVESRSKPFHCLPNSANSEFAG